MKIINSINYFMNLRKFRYNVFVFSINIVYIFVYCISLLYMYIFVMFLWRMCIDYSM